jgi:hypothetical protein
MALTIDQIYKQTIKPLPVPDRLRLMEKMSRDLASEVTDAANVPYDVEEEDEETERAAWRALSAKANSRVWDNPIDNELWDNWQPPKPAKRGK